MPEAYINEVVLGIVALLGMMVTGGYAMIEHLRRKSRQEAKAQAFTLEQTKERLNDLERRANEAGIRAAAAELRADRAENQNASLRAEIRQLRDAIADNQTAIQGLQKLLDEKHLRVTLLEKDIGELRERVAVLTTARDAANEERDGLLIENRALKAQRTALEKRIKALEEERIEDRNEIAVLRRQVDELRERLDKYSTSEQPVAEGVMP
jgi:chromosome segregation ATPase